MPQKSKADELYERIRDGNVDDYFKLFNAEDFKALTIAMADDDMNDLKELLVKNLKENKSGFETPIISGNYDAEVRELAERLLRREIKRREKQQITPIIEEEPRTRQVIFPPKEIRLAQKLKKPIKVKASPRQKEHRRTDPQSWEKTPRQIKFLQARKEMTGGQVYKEFIKFFGNIRTNRSVKSKFFRVR